jgi:hypothetical protein
MKPSLDSPSDPVHPIPSAFAAASLAGQPSPQPFPPLSDADLHQRRFHVVAHAPRPAETAPRADAPLDLDRNVFFPVITTADTLAAAWSITVWAGVAEIKLRHGEQGWIRTAPPYPTVSNPHAVTPLSAVPLPLHGIAIIPPNPLVLENTTLQDSLVDEICTAQPLTPESTTRDRWAVMVCVEIRDVHDEFEYRRMVMPGTTTFHWHPD